MKKTSPKNQQPETKPPTRDQVAFEQAVIQRAHQIWEQCGCPHGEDKAHWLQAERELREIRESAVKKS